MVCKWLDLLLEYLLYVWDFLGMVWTWIITNAGTIESVCILTITVYTFYLTIFPKKLKFLDFEFRYTAFYGETIKVSLENRSLSSVCVRNIYIKVEDKYLIPIFSGHEEGYRIIDSFHAESFISTHTQLKRKDGTELQIHPSAEGKFCLIIDTSRGRQKITTKVKPAPLNKHTNICVARTERIKFIDTVISKNVMYGVTYYDINNIKHTILISKAGSMSEPINDIHRIPNDYMRNEKMLRRFLDKEFQILGYSYILQPTVQNKIKCNARKPKYYKYRKYRCN